VFISGATGVRAFDINGFFEPTQEKGLDGRVLYAKRGDRRSFARCIGHYGGYWQVKLLSDKGTNGWWAYVAGGCGLEACTSRVWTVNYGSFMNEAWNDAPSVKLVAGAEAQRQVRGGCLRARLPNCNLAPPPPIPPLPSPPFPCFM
jgi:hypothetical protein